MTATPTRTAPLPQKHSTTTLRCHAAIRAPDGPDDHGNASLAMLRHLNEDYMCHHATRHGRSRMLRCYLAPGVYLRVEFRDGWFTADVTRMSGVYPEIRARDWDEFRHGLALLIARVEADYFENVVDDDDNDPPTRCPTPRATHSHPLPRAGRTGRRRSGGWPPDEAVPGEVGA